MGDGAALSSREFVGTKRRSHVIPGEFGNTQARFRHEFHGFRACFCSVRKRFPRGLSMDIATCEQEFRGFPAWFLRCLGMFFVLFEHEYRNFRARISRPPDKNSARFSR